MRKTDPARRMAASRASIVPHLRAILAFQRAGAEVFDNGNPIHTQARESGVEDAFGIPIFTEAYPRPLFTRAIGPYRWMALSGDPADIAHIDAAAAGDVPRRPHRTNWIRLARDNVPSEGLPARIARLGHGARTELALRVNEPVGSGALKGPVAFSRDHLDAGGMAHPKIMTEKMKDGSDAIADWPPLDAMLLCSSMADLVTVHSGGGYAGTMTSCGVTVVADGTDAHALVIACYAQPGPLACGRRLAAQGARGVILGCAGLGEFRAPLQGRLGLPVIDQVLAAMMATGPTR